MISHKIYQSYRLKYLTSTLFNLANEWGEISIKKRSPSMLLFPEHYLLTFVGIVPIRLALGLTCPPKLIQEVS